METGAKIKIKNLLKALVIDSDGISRKELASKSGLDVRTVSGYVDELLKKNIIAEKSSCPSGRGRPTALYCSNAGNLAFTGIIIRAESLEFCSCSVKGDVIAEGSEALPESETKLKTIKRILEKTEFLKKTAEAEGKTIAGIGIAVSRWLSPPLSGYDLYSDIAEIIERESGVPVFSTTPINAALYHIRDLSGVLRNMIVVHPGIVLELGIMLSGSISPDAREIEKNFSHICVDENGSECYCGKKGCLEHYTTQASVSDILKSEIKKDGLSELPVFEEGLKRGIPACVRTAEKVSSALANGIAAICRSYELDAVNFLAVPEAISGGAIKKIKTLPQFKGKKEVIFSAVQQINIARASALMAAFEVIRNFEKI